MRRKRQHTYTGANRIYQHGGTDSDTVAVPLHARGEVVMDSIKYSEINDLYTELQDRLSKKLDETYIPYRLTLTSKEREGYRKGILTCKSIIKDEFSRLSK